MPGPYPASYPEIQPVRMAQKASNDHIPIPADYDDMPAERVSMAGETLKNSVLLPGIDGHFQRGVFEYLSKYSDAQTCPCRDNIPAANSEKRPHPTFEYGRDSKECPIPSHEVWNRIYKKMGHDSSHYSIHRYRTCSIPHCKICMKIRERGLESYISYS